MSRFGTEILCQEQSYRATAINPQLEASSDPTTIHDVANFERLAALM